MKALCVHAHFYQPPRENPFTGNIPQELGAEPYHDWNQRINDECYRPNARLGNFELIGFDLGPTLASWLEKNDPFTYEAIIAADQKNVASHGLGNAIAQAYNHTILPLATHREKATQIAWGIADFEYRFSRKPQGMWLAETAVDIATLEVLAQFDISYTILAPWQAQDPCIDITEPYLVALPGGRQITVLFFDSQLAKNISWNPRVTRDAWEFAELCLPMRSSWYKERRDEDQILLIANDGEYYGHHHRGRERFLNTLLATAAPHWGYTPTHPMLYLQDHPAKREIRIVENTAWSCYHGVSRWKETCPCIVGDGSWKGHLRNAFDRLAERVDDIFETEVNRLLSSAKSVPGVFNVPTPLGEQPNSSTSGPDMATGTGQPQFASSPPASPIGRIPDGPWSLLRDFIAVVLERVDGPAFIQSTITPTLEPAAQARLLDLLWAQYYRQLTYTSCGFFFEDLSRIEPKNNIAYAAKAIELVKRATGHDLQPEFLTSLEPARSSITGQTGADIYRELLAN